MKIENLFVNSITEKTLERHKELGRSDTFFSGIEKKVDDKFFLAVLLIPDHREDLQIVIDVCEQDIIDETYRLQKIQTVGGKNLAYFKLNKTNDHIIENIAESLKLTKTEERLEDLKKKIEIEVQLNKG